MEWYNQAGVFDAWGRAVAGAEPPRGVARPSIGAYQWHGLPDIGAFQSAYLPDIPGTTYFKTLTATAGHTATSAQTLTWAVQLSATHTHGADIQKGLSYTVSLHAVHNSNPTLSPIEVQRLTLSAVAGHTASVIAAKTIGQTLSATAGHSASLSTVLTPGDPVVASQIKTPVNKDMQQPFVQEWHNVYRPTFGELIGLGYVYGAEAITVGGHIEGLGVGDGHVAFYDPILPFPDPLTAETVYLVSSSSSDTMQVEIEGIDTSGLRSRSRVNLTGTTPVPAPRVWNHVFSIKTIGASNVGTIYCSINNLALPTTVADKIQCVIEADVSVGFNPEIRAADNEVIFIHEFDFSTDTREEFDMRLEVFREGAWERLFRYYSDASIVREYKVPLTLAPGEGLRICIGVEGGVSANATYSLNGALLIDDAAYKRGYRDQAGVDYIFE